MAENEHSITYNRHKALTPENIPEHEAKVSLQKKPFSTCVASGVRMRRYHRIDDVFECAH